MAIDTVKTNNLKNMAISSLIVGIVAFSQGYEFHDNLSKEKLAAAHIKVETEKPNHPKADGQ